MKTLIGTVNREYMRFEGDPDTICLSIDVDGREETVKVKEDEEDRLYQGDRVCFWGRNGTYRGKPQFQGYFYAPEDAIDTIESIRELTDGRKFPRTIAKQAYNVWGDNAPRFIRKNPFRLLVFDRVGFKTADALYMELGLPPAAIKRQLLCGMYEIEHARSGSVWHPRQMFADSIKQSIDGVDPKVARAIELGRRSKRLSEEWTWGPDGEIDYMGDYAWVATKRDSFREQVIAEEITILLEEFTRWSPPEGKGKMSVHQIGELQKAMQCNVGLLMGGGGVGKTFVIAQLISWLTKGLGIPPGQIGLIAPTGRAAVRLTEEMITHGLRGVDCRTYHSTLGFAIGGWKYHADNPLPVQVLIGDETSMVDQHLMCSILQARPRGCPFLMVGDPYQLPPVGNGAPFRDFQHLVPSGHLTEVLRNSGTIKAVAQKVREGAKFNHDDEFDLENDRNYIHMQLESEQGQLHMMDTAIDMISRMPECDNWVWDIQVLGIVNKNSEISVHELNKKLQLKFNGDQPAVQGTPFRLHDKVLNTSNSWCLPAKTYCSEHGVTQSDGEIYVANGEMGSIEEINQKTIDGSKVPSSFVIRVRDPDRYVIVPTRNVLEGSEEGKTGSNWQLGYAITTHKSQGSQFNFVIAMIDGSGAARSIADKSLWYTMLTRTKIGCVSIGRKEVILAASKRCAIDKRKTFLVERAKELISD